VALPARLQPRRRLHGDRRRLQAPTRSRVLRPQLPSSPLLPRSARPDAPRPTRCSTARPRPGTSARPPRSPHRLGLLRCFFQGT
jgi:hypothetical protein